MNANEWGRRPLYRSRRGRIAGVCKGVAEYFEIPVFWVRVFAVVLLFFTGVWPMVALYLLAAFLMKPEPVIPLRTAEDQAFYDTYTGSRTAALRNLKRTYERLDRRLRRLEDHVTAREYDWDRRFRTGE